MSQNPIDLQATRKTNKKTKLTGTPCSRGGVKHVRFPDGSDTLLQEGQTNAVAKGSGGASIAGSRTFQKAQQRGFGGKQK